MNKLNKMLFREIIHSKGQFIAAAAVIAVGLMMYGSTYTSYRNLTNSIDYYYSQYNFLDYYAEAENISDRAVENISKLDGVKQAIGRIAVNVGADMAKNKRVTLRLLSVPDNKSPEINKIYVVSGGYFRNNKQNTCLLSQKFAEANGFEKGDRIKIIINSRIHEFIVDGIVGSPEFIYAIKSASSFSPSVGDYGILFIKESTARSLLGFKDGYNELHVIFDDAVRIADEENYRFNKNDNTQGIEGKQIINKIEKLLVPYGFKVGYERKDQLSNTAVQSEIKQLKSMSYSFPILFLTVAGLIIYIMQRRLISNQRTQIGVMKAFGYSSIRILLHYILFSAIIAISGAIPGVILGLLLGVGWTSAYKDVFSIPVMYIRIYWDTIFIGLSLSTAFCLFAGFNAAKRVLRLDPAKSMRPEAPKMGKHIGIERISSLWSSLSFSWKLSIRNIFRSGQRTIFTALGVIFTIMFLMVSLFFWDTMDFIIFEHFQRFQKQDLKVTFSKPASIYDAFELEKVEGVRRSEPIIEMPVELRNSWRKKSGVLVGLVSRNTFYGLVDEKLNKVLVPDNGILIAHTLTGVLGVKPGDTIEVRPYIGQMKEKKMRIVNSVKQYFGFNSYANVFKLGEITGEGHFATGSLLSVEDGMEERATKKLLEIPGVETVESREDSFNSYYQYMGLLYAFIGIMLICGIIMGFAIIYNTTVINLTERKREMASLRVLGYTSKEIEKTVFRENMILSILAVIPGIFLGRWACTAMAKSFSSELFTIEAVIYPRTYFITLICVFVFVVLAGWANKNKIYSLDMVEVLKNREGG